MNLKRIQAQVIATELSRQNLFTDCEEVIALDELRQFYALLFLQHTAGGY